MKKDLLIAPYGINPDTKQANLPNPTQDRVLEWVDTIRAKEEHDHLPVLALCGGVGSGKSRGMLAPVQEMLLEIPNIRILWGRADFKDIKLSIMDKFFEVFPAELIKKKSEQYHWYDISQPGGGTGRIYFNGLKDIGGLGSQEFGIIVVTEAHEITEYIYRALKRRCRQENVVNMILLESEPPNEDHWLMQLTNPGHELYDKDIERWELSTYENWNNLPKSYRGSLESMPEAWKRKYLYGKAGFIPDGKPFYSGFKEHIHAGEFEPNRDKPLIIGVDYGFWHPAMIITQLDVNDRWIWLRELMGTEITIQNFREIMLRVLGEYYRGMEYIWFGDPAGNQKNDKSERTSVQILAEKGIRVKSRGSSYRERKEIIEGKLGRLIGGKPALMLDRRYCRVSIEGFLGGYHYPVRKPGVRITDPYEQPFRDGYYEHLLNAGEYIAVNMFKPVEIRKELDYRRKALYYDKRKTRKRGFKGG